MQNEKNVILILGNQRSWTSISTQIITAHGATLNVPSRLDPTGFVRTNCELHSLMVLGKLVFQHCFGFHENAVPYSIASETVLPLSMHGYPPFPEQGNCADELIQYGVDLFDHCTDPITVLKYPSMVLCWNFWKKVIESRQNNPRFILGMTVRNPYEVALSYYTRSATNFQHMSDVYGMIEAYYRCELAIIEEYRNKAGYTVLPIRANSEHYQADMARLLLAAGVKLSEGIYNEHFHSKETHDTGIREDNPVFEIYEQFLEACETL